MRMGEEETFVPINEKAFVLEVRTGQDSLSWFQVSQC